MDLNQLFYRHQLALIRVSSSDDRHDRLRHEATADNFADRIRRMQNCLGADAVPLMSAGAL